VYEAMPRTVPQTARKISAATARGVS
jgi:hypothetical protein